MGYFIVLIGLAAGFFLLQIMISSKTKNSYIRCIPAVLLFLGLLFCLITYMGLLGAYSESAAAENRAFAKALAIHIIAGLVGCTAGAFLSKVQLSEKS